MTEAENTESTGRVEFRVSPDRYRHWKLSADGPVATLTMDVDEHGGLVPGLGGVAAGAAAARGAAGYRRADPGVRQAVRAAGSGRLLLHQVRGRRREEGRAVAPGG